MMLIRYSNSDWLFMTQSRVLQADWMIMANIERVTIHICRPFLAELPGRCLDTEHVQIYILQMGHHQTHFASDNGSYTADC